MSIRRIQTNDRVLNQLQQNVAQAIGPVLANPLVQGVLLKSVSLKSGINSIPHGLGRTLQGWVITRIRGSATVYDSQDSNTTPTTALSLVASAPVTVDLYVF